MEDDSFNADRYETWVWRLRCSIMIIMSMDVHCTMNHCDCDYDLVMIALHIYIYKGPLMIWPYKGGFAVRLGWVYRAYADSEVDCVRDSKFMFGSESYKCDFGKKRRLCRLIGNLQDSQN